MTVTISRRATATLMLSGPWPASSPLVWRIPTSASWQTTPDNWFSGDKKDRDADGVDETAAQKRRRALAYPALG